jgi:hypothetical protein
MLVAVMGYVGPSEVFAHPYIDPRGRDVKSRKPNQFGMTKGSD